MKILLIGARSPLPAQGGGQIRRWEILRYLARRHELTFLYFAPPDARAIPDALRQICARIERVNLPRAEQISAYAPQPALQHGVAAMRRAIKASAPALFDLVLVDSLYMSPYRALLPPQTVLLEQNIESRIYKQIAQHNAVAAAQTRLDFTWRMVEQYENRAWAQFALRVVVSEHDQRAMMRRCARGTTIVAENGVDLDAHPRLPRSRARAALFAGALDYFPNADAAQFLVREILPRLERELVVHIAGRHPPPEIQALSNSPRVRVIADPLDMSSVAAQNAVAVVPLRIGSGTRLKILEAWAWGIPVVTTTRGCEGLDARDGCEVLIRDDPQAFADALARLLDDDALAQRLSANGRALVERRYAWKNILPKFEDALARFVADKKYVV
ncbi:MAG: glycosyl transferase family 1 [Chloroflexota bacterium]|nr:MAG: glycosyl transferase family 1 [Chloroflexota bacterium]